MNAIWANRLVAGTRKWAEVPASRKAGVKAELASRVENGKISAEQYEEITGESYPVQKEEEVAVAAAPVTETPQVPVTAETKGGTEDASEGADVTSEK